MAVANEAGLMGQPAMLIINAEVSVSPGSFRPSRPHPVVLSNVKIYWLYEVEEE